jgi:integrase
MSAVAVRAVEYDPLRDARHKEAAAASEVANWLAFLDGEGKAPRTLEDYERTAAALLRMYPNTPFAEFDEIPITHCLRTFPVGSRRIRRAHLSSLFKWGDTFGHIDRNPMGRVPKPKATPRKVIETFTPAEQALLVNLPYPHGQLMTILLDTGIRKAEARNLRVRHVDFSRRRLIIAREGAKGSKERVVGITRRLATALDELTTLGGLNRDDFFWYTNPGGGKNRYTHRCGEGTFHRWWEQCLSDAGVEYIPHKRGNPHTTRHTFALRWLRAGGRLETLSETLGHASIKTTYDEYGHLTIDDVLADLDLLEV